MSTRPKTLINKQTNQLYTPAQCIFNRPSPVPRAGCSSVPRRQYVVRKCPYLIQEMVTCISQLVMLAHAGRISRLPSLETIDNTMKLSPMVVQALWDSKSVLLQLPHVDEGMLRHFVDKKVGREGKVRAVGVAGTWCDFVDKKVGREEKVRAVGVAGTLM